MSSRRKFLLIFCFIVPIAFTPTLYYYIEAQRHKESVTKDERGGIEIENRFELYNVIDDPEEIMIPLTTKEEATDDEFLPRINNVAVDTENVVFEEKGVLPEVADLSDPWLVNLKEGYKKTLRSTHKIGDCEYNNYQITTPKGLNKYYISGMQITKEVSNKLRDSFDEFRMPSLYGFLSEFHEWANSVNMLYTLNFGVALGLCRNGKPFVFDKDIDIQVSYEDFMRIRKEFYKPYKGKEAGGVCDRRPKGSHCGLIKFNGKEYGLKNALAHTDSSLLQFYSYRNDHYVMVDMFVCQMNNGWCSVSGFDKVGKGPNKSSTEMDFPVIKMCGMEVRFAKEVVTDKERFCEEFTDHRYGRKRGRERLARDKVKNDQYLSPCEFDLNICGGHGKCKNNHHDCYCEDGWGGKKCEINTSYV